jgi:predicted metal-binding membrane protein
MLAGLGVVTTLSWLYLFVMAVGMANMGDGMPAMMLKRWTLADAVMMFVMWAVMMVAMMVPSVTPVVLLYARVCRRQRIGTEALVPTGAFLSGYIVVWTIFSATATALQWGLEQAALLSPMMVSTSEVLGGLVLIAAGVYQWTPYKDTCLRHCRSPVDFLSKRWRHGSGGAFAMGLEHGAYCLGCCWILMAILFVGGVMNLLCVAAIAIFVLVEKAVPLGHVIGKAAAGLMILVGFVMVLNG